MTDTQPSAALAGRNLPPAQLLAGLSGVNMLDAAPEGLRTPQPQRLIPGAVSYRNIGYAVVLGYRPLLLDIHVPADRPGPHPVVVYAHPGGWIAGLKEMGPWPFLPEAGYAVVSVSYRLRDEAVYPGPLHDVKAAIRWVRANGAQYGLRTDRIAGWGSSAGAFLLTMAGLTNGDQELEGDLGTSAGVSSDLAAVIDFYGPTDWTTFGQDAHPDGPVELPGTPDSTESRFLGYVPADDPGRARAASPIDRVHAGAPPMLICHGDTDMRVGQRQSVRFHEALRAAGVDATFVDVAGGDHGGPQFETAEMRARVLSFLERTLAPAQDEHP
ncbi:alpha/beta hydrolase [Nocardia alni]|uniref:alpha/beta hydrolase n=1 Tax=Nocardia alni TaxID=2815723 RepID=UPI001C245C93|nr:alpha/beta hydrolase [Nocardia alni]